MSRIGADKLGIWAVVVRGGDGGVWGFNASVVDNVGQGETVSVGKEVLWLALRGQSRPPNIAQDGRTESDPSYASVIISSRTTAHGVASISPPSSRCAMQVCVKVPDPDQEVGGGSCLNPPPAPSSSRLACPCPSLFSEPAGGPAELSPRTESDTRLDLERSSQRVLTFEVGFQSARPSMTMAMLYP